MHCLALITTFAVVKREHNETNELSSLKINASNCFLSSLRINSDVLNRRNFYVYAIIRTYPLGGQKLFPEGEAKIYIWVSETDLREIKKVRTPRLDYLYYMIHSLLSLPELMNSIRIKVHISPVH